jgi:hypothetical protein
MFDFPMGVRRSPCWSWAFAADKVYEVFSGYQPRHVSVSSSGIWWTYHIPDDDDQDGPRNVGFIQIPDTTDSQEDFIVFAILFTFIARWVYSNGKGPLG